MARVAPERACILTLKATFQDHDRRWGLDEVAEVRISPTMHELYLEDLPRAWGNAALRKRLVVIGPNDYFYKWRGDEFMHFASSPLAHLLDRVEERYAAGAVLDGKVSGLPLAGGNHQLLFINRRYTSVVPATFDELLAETWRLRNSNTLLWPFVYPTNACYFVLPLLYGYHSPLWSDPARPEVGITRDALYQVLLLHKELMYDRVILPVKWEQYHSVFEFQTGRAAFCFGGDWDIQSHRETLGDDLVIAPIPSLERECRSTASCSYLYLSSELEPVYLDSVARAAELLLSEEVQRDIVQSLHRYPARKGMPLDLTATDPNLRRSYEVYSSAIFLPPHRILSHIYHVLGDLFEPGVLVKYPLNELADRAHAKMQDVASTIAIR
jgi:hypothetical protein